MGKVAVVEEKNTLPSLVNSQMLLEDEGAGQEGINREDLAIPFLQVLQQLSPQCNKRDGAYVDGAEAGMIINTVTNELWDGEKGAIVVPVYYTREHVEWKPRSAGGGFVKSHGPDSSILAAVTRDNEGRDMLPNGNQIVTCGNRYVLIVDENGAFTQALISMSSTQLKISNRWNTMINTLNIPRPDGKGLFNPASFYQAYRLKTVPQSNDKGSWFGWSVAAEKPTLELPNGEGIYLAARKFRASVMSGDVKVAQPSPDSGATDDEIPF